MVLGRLIAGVHWATDIVGSVFLSSGLFMIYRYMADYFVLKKVIAVFANVFSACMVIGRLVSGVHWATDIVGSVFLSLGLYMIYRFMAECTGQKKPYQQLEASDGVQ